MKTHPWHQFHLQQNTNPERLRGFLDSGFAHPELQHLSAGTVSLFCGYLRGLGILDSNNQLTAFGERLQSLNKKQPELVPEAIHILLRCRAFERDPPRFAFAYSTLCDIAWSQTENGSSELDRRWLLQETRAAIKRHYHLSDESLAFSLDSIRGALHWLTALPDPPFSCTNKGKLLVRRRETFPNISLLWIGACLSGHPKIEEVPALPVNFLARLLFAEIQAVHHALCTLISRLPLNTTLKLLNQGVTLGNLTSEQT